MGQLKHFKDWEFDCKCGCGLGLQEMKPQLIDQLQVARELADISFEVSSAIRCQSHNRNVGGSQSSSHLTGWAVDLKVRNSHHRFKLIKYLLIAGFNRILIYKDFIHVDCDPVKTPEVISYMMGKGTGNG